MNTISIKKSLLALGVLSFAVNAAWADHDDRFDADRYQVYARVISSTPEYERINQPQEECSSQFIRGGGEYYERTNSNNSITGSVVGGITGALLGSRLGKGKGNRAATAAGAIAGAVIGNQIQLQGDSARCGGRPRDRYEPAREVRNCRVVDHWENRLTGYRVTYVYAGRQYTTSLPYDPGQRLPVRVSVAPL